MTSERISTADITTWWDRLCGREIIAECRENWRMPREDLGLWLYEVTITNRSGISGTGEHPWLSTAKYLAEKDLRLQRVIAKDQALFANPKVPGNE